MIWHRITQSCPCSHNHVQKLPLAHLPKRYGVLRDAMLLSESIVMPLDSIYGLFPVPQRAEQWRGEVPPLLKGLPVAMPGAFAPPHTMAEPPLLISEGNTLCTSSFLLRTEKRSWDSTVVSPSQANCYTELCLF